MVNPAKHDWDSEDLGNKLPGGHQLVGRFTWLYEGQYNALFIIKVRGRYLLAKRYPLGVDPLPGQKFDVVAAHPGNAKYDADKWWQEARTVGFIPSDISRNRIQEEVFPRRRT